MAKWKNFRDKTGLAVGDRFGFLSIKGKAPRKITDSSVCNKYICLCDCGANLSLPEDIIKKRRACSAKCFRNLSDEGW